MSRLIVIRACSALSVAMLTACAQFAPTGAPAPSAAAGGRASSAATASAATPSSSATAARATAAASAPTGGASAPSAAAAPGQPPAFATVIKDAKQTEGLIAYWQKDDKVWLELKPEDFNRPFFLSPKLARGIGEAGIFGGSISVPGSRIDEHIVEFRRVHNLIQLVAVNSSFVVRDPKAPEARAVAASFAPSLLSSTTVASQPHPERKTVLVDAGPLFLNDMLGLGAALQRAYRQGYALESRNTYFTSVRGGPDHLVLNANAHFYTANIAAPQPGAPTGAPAPTAPSTVPDPRSIMLGLYYAISKLPEQPMASRAADARIGYFTTIVDDFSNDLARSPRQRFVNRWRLEKKDLAASLSEPVKPITFWLDKTIPLKYRDAISRGVLEWNKAFEKIGFKDALVVKVQPDDADFDTLDVGAASIRWMTNARPSFGAIGPSQVDPRSGEILDADIAVESLTSRSLRALRAQILGGRAAIDWPALMQSPDADPQGPSASEQRLAGLMRARRGGDVCQHAEFAAEQLSYALDVLEARAELDPAGPEAQQFVLDYLTDMTMHEVGHTLGLRHNFRSSRVYTDSQLSDRDFTARNGLAGSVMEYAPINLPRPGEAGGTPFQTALGPYDYWAIEYGYRPIAATEEAAELQRIAARSAEPQLAYGTDEDNFLGIDPESLQFDLGDDVIAFAKKRIEIARDLLARQEARVLSPDSDYSVLRRSVSYAVRDAARAVGLLARQIGGVRTLRDHPGSGRDPLVPVAAAVQREALDTLARGVLSADSLRLSPALQRKLAPDFNERGEALSSGEGSVATDYSIVGTVIDMQRALLAQLMSDGVASRLLDSEGKVERAANGTSADFFRLSELYGRLAREIWSEVGTKSDIPIARRELQRDHAGRLAAMLLRPAGSSRADTKSVVRAEAQSLVARIHAAVKRPGLSAEARAHLAESAETLTQALAARLQRAGV